MLLCILTVDKKSISFFSLGIEVVVVGKKVLEVNGGLIQQHSGNGWSILFSKDSHDRSVDVVANEVVSLLPSQSIQLVHVDLRELEIHLLLLLLHHLLVLLWIHLLRIWLAGLVWLLPLSWSDLGLRHVGNLLGVVEVGSVLVLVLVVAILLVSLLMMLLILML